MAATKKKNRARTLVLGLGNPILGDDAVGLVVAEKVGALLDGNEEVEVRQASVAGFDLLDLLAGFERAYIADAVRTGGKAGTIYKLGLDCLPLPERLGTMHEINLATSIELGRSLGLPMPEEIHIFAVEVSDDRTFAEGCSAEVQTAAEKAAVQIAQEICRSPAGRSAGAFDHGDKPRRSDG